ncbi:hypothetical protein Trydic_g22609 [Trypoxylus dichotomus]
MSTESTTTVHNVHFAGKIYFFSYTIQDEGLSQYPVADLNILHLLAVDGKLLIWHLIRATVIDFFGVSIACVDVCLIPSARFSFPNAFMAESWGNDFVGAIFSHNSSIVFQFYLLKKLDKDFFNIARWFLDSLWSLMKIEVDGAPSGNGPELVATVLEA